MLTKEEITKAVKQSNHVKRDYPEFWKFHTMLLDLNNNPGEVKKIQEVARLTNGKV